VRRRLGIVAALAGALLAVTAAVGAGPATAAEPAHYYVSLGDSLAAGYQPDAHRNVPGVSYTDQLYTRLKAQDPTLRHVQFGCSGETTTTMIDGGICGYSGGASQLDAAAAFLRQHRGQVTTVTLDIGANDVDGCFSASAIDTGCVLKGLGTSAVNLPKIAHRLRTAGGGKPRYAGMTYYDPFLAVWLTGPQGQAEATASVPLADTLNTVLTAAMLPSGFRIAAGGSAFATNDFTPTAAPGFGTLPKNVATICALTWMCTAYQDIHATPAGHAVLATAFQKALARP
jgi:lysophospholipase L1-like esterase